MTTLQKTFKYDGTNADLIISDFPRFTDVKLEIAFPTYKFVSINSGKSFARNFVKDMLLSNTVPIKSTNYSQAIALEMITGDDYQIFLGYYASFLRFNENSLFNFQKYKDGLKLLIETKVNLIHTQGFLALPLVLLTGDKSLLSSNVGTRSAMLVAPMRDTEVLDDGIKKYLDENLFLLNLNVLDKVIEKLNDVSIASLMLFLSHAIKGGSIPVLSIPPFNVLNEQIAAFGSSISDFEYNQLTTLITKQFKNLFDFPINVPEIRPVAIKGDIVFSGTESVIFRDLSNYDLVVDYQFIDGIGISAKSKSIKYHWQDFSDSEIPDRKAFFNFQQNNDFVFDANTSEKIEISLKLFDGTILWHHLYEPDDAQLSSIHITVPLLKANQIGRTNTNELPTNLKLKGKVVEATGKCPLKDLTVILQAKTKKEDTIWKVVGVAITDVTGSFSMAYPMGVYEDAQAIVSITPNNPVEITVNTDDIHKAALQTISKDFLFLLVDGAGCNDEAHKPDDCECHSAGTKTPRLPNQEDLIGSDKFSQDLGGGTCVNLTTPNRTLSEQSYYAIVRSSDPDVANYVLQKNAETDAEGFQKVKFSLGDGKKIERNEVNFENMIRWQDAPDTTDKDNHLSIYQAVSVAHGHLLHYKSVLKADGYSLGDLLYSLPLAPGQKKQIVVYDWKRSLQGSETQQFSQRERIDASIVNDRTLIDNLSGGINESLRGQSSASTGGVSAGLGVGAILGPVGAVLGVSGGYSSSSSRASQDSSRNTVQAFNEVLRNSVMQSASAYREFNGTLIDTVTEGQQFATTTEVVANHNHCHSLTMLYFEVLRHYAVYQELAQVEECIFVPLIMTNFSQENIHKWRDVLAASLLYRPSNTYLPYFGSRNPLVRAFDANDRVMTNWANVDFPTGRYCDETIINVKGEMSVRVHLPRPKTKYDRIKSLPIISKTVTHEEFDLATTARSAATAVLTGGLSLLFGGGSTTRTVSEQIQVRAQIFDAFMQLDANYQTVSPAQCIRVTSFQPQSMSFFGITIPVSGLDFFENGLNDKLQWEAYANILGYSGSDGVYKMLDYYFKGRLIAEWDDIFNNDIAPLVFEKMLRSVNLQLIGTDLTSTSRYRGGERIMSVNTQGSTNLRRIDFPDHIKISSNSPAVKSLNGHVVFNIENVRITYSTAHYNGVLFSGRIQDSLLEKDTDLFIPVSNEEKRNPRKEDKFIVNELITHLNSNLEYYNKVLWYNLDQDRRYLLLDGFHIQVYDDLNRPAAYKSLASIVKNQLIGVAGNSLIFPVAAGVKVDRSYIIINNDEGEEARISLFDHYRPLTPTPPYRISVPTRGIYAEAVQGNCDACEKVKDNSSQDWDKFKTDEPTTIGTVTVPTPTPTDWKAAFKDFATPIVNIQNAPAAPAPGAGLAGLSELLGKSDIFKDVTGLDANQKNAMATYLSNQENAKAFASMAKDMAMQGHNTQNADKIQGAINQAQSSGAISKEDANKLTKDHIQQMIDGGETKKAEAEKAAASKPSLTDAAVKAVDQGKAVKAESTNATTGKTEKVEIEGNTSENILAQITGIVPKLTQENEMACWATAATMMVCWKKSASMSVPDVLALAGDKYVQKFNNGEGLASSEKEEFITALDMVGEPPASYTLQQYIDWVKIYGPLWVTTDSSTETGDFSPHARILTKITGSGTPDGNGTFFTFIDPASGTEVKESFAEFLNVYEQMVTDNAGGLFIQIVHFKEELSTEGKPKTKELTLFGSYVWNPPINDATEISLLAQGKWHPSTLDFMAVTGENASFSIGNFSALMGEIGKQKNKSIKRFNFFTHANSAVLGIAGHMDSTNVFFDTFEDSTTIENFVTTDTKFTLDNKTYSIDDIRGKFTDDAIFVLYGCNIGANLDLLKALNKLFGVQVIGFKKPIIFCPPTQTTSFFKRTGTKIGIDNPAKCDATTTDWRSLIKDPEAQTIP